MIAIKDQLFVIVRCNDDYYCSNYTVNVCAASSEESAQTIVELLTMAAEYDEAFFEHLLANHIREWENNGNEQPSGEGYDYPKHNPTWTSSDATDAAKKDLADYRARMKVWGPAKEAAKQAFIDASYNQQQPDVIELMEALSLKPGDLGGGDTFKYEPLIVVSPTKER